MLLASPDRLSCINGTDGPWEPHDSSHQMEKNLTQFLTFESHWAGFGYRPTTKPVIVPGATVQDRYPRDQFGRKESRLYQSYQ